jgi:hypothetical protein
MTTLRQATNYTRVFYYGTAGQTVAVTLSKNGGTFAAAAGTVAEISNGWYKIALTAVDTNTFGDLAYHCTAGAGGPADFFDNIVTKLLSDVNIDGSGNVSIASSIKQNQALNGFTFVMTDSTTHAPRTGLTVSSQRSLGGAGFGPCANSATEMSNGIYVINLAASDTNATCVMFRFTAAGADDLDILIVTQP